MPSQVRIERITSAATGNVFPQLARIHCQEVAEGFLTSLGPFFLAQLYRSLAAAPGSFLFAALRHEDVLGFICGATETRRIYRHFLLRRAWWLAPIIAPQLVGSARRLRLSWETWCYPSRSQRHALPHAEILNFCVRSSEQGQGLGKRLFSELVGEFQRRRVRHIRIVTGQQQRRAQRFYDGVGATRQQRIEVHHGSQSIAYVYDVMADPLSTRSAA